MTKSEPQDVIDDLTDDRDLWKARAILAKARVKKLEAIILQVTDAVYGKLQWSLEEGSMELWP